MIHFSQHSNKWLCSRVKAVMYLVVFLFIPDNAISGDFFSKQFGTRDGLPSNTIYAMLQDKKGDVWFTTEFGVSRYNGFQFENFNLEDGLSDNDVFKLYQDNKGRIWFLLSNGKINYYENGEIHNPENTPLLRGLQSLSFFNGFLEEPDGSIWFTTYRDGIYKLEKNGKIRRLKPLADLSASVISSGIWRDLKGHVKICTNLGIVNLSQSPGMVEVPISIKSDEIRFAKMLRDGSTLIFTGNKILKCEGKLISDFGKTAGYNDYIVSNVVENDDGDLWISAINGLHLFRKGSPEKVNYQAFFKGRTISGFFFDRQGSLWVSTLNEGAFLVKDVHSFRYGRSDMIPDVPITSLYLFHNRLYFGNDRGGLGHLNSGKVTLLNPGSKLSQFGRGRIREFKSDPFFQNLLWVVSENGLLLSDGNTFQSYFPSPSKSIEFKDQNILLGNSSSCMEINYKLFRNAGNYYLDKLRKSPFDSIAILNNMKSIWPDFHFLLPETRVYKLLRDESGAIWMATNSGIFSLQFGKVIYHREKNPEFGYPFQTMCLLGNGTLAAGSNGRGILLIMPNGNTQWIKRKQGLVSNYFRNLKAQGKDSLWACTPAGLNLISTRTGAGCLNIRSWTSANSGLLSNDVFDVAVQDDSLWLAGGSEIICIPSFRENSNFSTPRAEAEMVLINGLKQTISKALTIEDEGSNELLIQLRNPDYRNQGRIEFQYRILPDSLWKLVQGNEIREILNKPGDYDVEIRRILNQVPETGYSLMQVRVKPGIKSISNLKSIDWNIRLPLFVFISVMLLAVFMELNFSAKTTSPKEEDPDSVWKNTGKLQRYIFNQLEQPGFEEVQEKFFAFRSILAGRQGQPTELEDEFVLCQHFYLILRQLNPDIQLELKKPEENDEIHLILEGHPILQFLMNAFQLPPSSGKFLLNTAFTDHGMDVLLQDKTTSGIIQQTKIALKQKPGFFNLPAQLFSRQRP